MADSKNEYNSLKYHQDISDEDLFAAYVKEFDQKQKKEYLSCPGCNNLATCRCAAEDKARK